MVQATPARPAGVFFDMNPPLGGFVASGEPLFLNCASSLTTNPCEMRQGPEKTFRRACFGIEVQLCRCAFVLFGAGYDGKMVSLTFKAEPVLYARFGGHCGGLSWCCLALSVLLPPVAWAVHVAVADGGIAGGGFKGRGPSKRGAFKLARQGHDAGATKACKLEPSRRQAGCRNARSSGFQHGGEKGSFSLRSVIGELSE